MLAFDDEGRGPAVLLLHSGITDRRMWRPQLPTLAASHRVLTPDLPGFGRTPPTDGGDDAPAAIVDLLDQGRIERAAVVGSSLGGRIALELVDRFPDRVGRLVLLAPAYRWIPASPDAVAFAAEEERLLREGAIDAAVDLNVSTWLGPEADPETVELTRSMLRNLYESRLATGRLLVSPFPESPEPDLPAIPVPTTVVSGALDLPHFRAVADHLVARIPDSTAVRLPWAAHLPSLERPGEMTRMLTRLLA